jgi:hypothetical protein
VVTTLRSSFQFRPAEHWTVLLTGIYSKQESATETSQVVGVFVPLGETTLLQDGRVSGFFPPDTAVRYPFDVPGTNLEAAERRVVTVDNAIDIDTWTLRASATRQLTYHLSCSVNATYRKQDNNSQALATANSFDGWRVGVSLRYSFDPIVF